MTYEPKVGDEVVMRGTVGTANSPDGVYFTIITKSQDEFFVHRGDLEPVKESPDPFPFAAKIDDLDRRVAALEARARRASPPHDVGPCTPPPMDEREILDVQGRVLRSRTRDVDPQGDWSTARSVPANASL